MCDVCLCVRARVECLSNPQYYIKSVTEKQCPGMNHPERHPGVNSPACSGCVPRPPLGQRGPEAYSTKSTVAE